MDIQFDKVSEVKGVVKLSLVEADYRKDIDRKLKERAKKANLKGYRKGKIPKVLIQKMYGDQIAFEYVSKLVGEKLDKILEERGIETVGKVFFNEEEIEKISWFEDQEISLEVEVGIVPAFELEIDSSVEVDHYTSKLTDQDFEREVSYILQDYGDFVDVEVSKKNDILLGHLYFRNNNDVQTEQEESAEPLALNDQNNENSSADEEKASQPSSEEQGGSHEKDYDEYEVMASQEERYEEDIDDDLDILDLRKLVKTSQALFIGKKSGDVITFNPLETLENKAERDLFLGDYEDMALLGKFRFEVKRIQRVVPAKLDQALFDQLMGKGSVQSEEEFLKVLRVRMTRALEEDMRADMEVFIIRKLIENASIELPEDIIKKTLLAGNEVTEENIEMEYLMTKRVTSWFLIKKRIIQEQFETSEIVDEATKDFLETIQAHYDLGDTKDLTEEGFKTVLDHYMKEQNESFEDLFNKFYDRTAQKKVLAYLKEKITLTPKEIPFREYFETYGKQQGSALFDH